MGSQKPDMSGIRMVGICSVMKFYFRKQKCPVFKCFRYSNVRFSDPYCKLHCCFFIIFPFTGILAFPPPGLGSYLMRAIASYSYEGLIAVVVGEIFLCLYWVGGQIKVKTFGMILIINRDKCEPCKLLRCP